LPPKESSAYWGEFPVLISIIDLIRNNLSACYNSDADTNYSSSSGFFFATAVFFAAIFFTLNHSSILLDELRSS